MVKNTETNKNSTYQIIVNKQENNTVVNNAIKKANKIRLILIGSFLAVVLGIIIFFVVRHKKMKNEELYNEDDEEYSEEEPNEVDKKAEETLDLNNEEELFKRVNKSKFKSTDFKETDKIINEENSNTEYNKKTEITDEHFKKSDNNLKGKHF